MNKQLDNEVILLMTALLKTNSPAKRIEATNKWAASYGYDKKSVASIVLLLQSQKSEKANQGAVGGKSSAKNGTEQIAILRDIRDALSQSTAAKKGASKAAVQDYSLPMWAWKCSAVCTMCGDRIDGCGFRWKRNGQYSSYHPTCIPAEYKDTFENIKGFRAHFKLDQTDHQDQMLN